MTDKRTKAEEITIGIDLGDRFSHACVLDAHGKKVDELRFRTTKAAVEKALAKYPTARVIVETGTHSPWVSRLLESLGHEVVVAHARRLQLIAHGDRKNDRNDAEYLARLGRVDPELLCPVTHRSEQAHKDLMLLQARDGLVRMRTRLINQTRGFAKSLGVRLPSCSAPSFVRQVRGRLSAELFAGFDELLELIDRLTEHVRVLTRKIESLCKDRYQDTALLRQVGGVGPITALSFVVTIDDPHRFAKSRIVGAYLGLRPRQRDSGESRRQLGITKAGSSFVRRHLVQAAHYILGPFGPDTDLRRYGLRVVARGGKGAKKRAVVAVARKLAILLHRLWVSRQDYQPVGYGMAYVDVA